MEATTMSASISRHIQGAAASTDACSCKRMLGAKRVHQRASEVTTFNLKGASMTGKKKLAGRRCTGSFFADDAAGAV
eukprot:605724-Pelagomonas_calceolata.AAC.7